MCCPSIWLGFVRGTAVGWGVWPSGLAPCPLSARVRSTSPRSWYFGWRRALTGPHGPEPSSALAGQNPVPRRPALAVAFVVARMCRRARSSRRCLDAPSSGRCAISIREEADGGRRRPRRGRRWRRARVGARPLAARVARLRQTPSGINSSVTVGDTGPASLAPVRKNPEGRGALRSRPPRCRCGRGTGSMGDRLCARRVRTLTNVASSPALEPNLSSCSGVVGTRPPEWPSAGTLPKPHVSTACAV